MADDIETRLEDWGARLDRLESKDDAAPPAAGGGGGGYLLFVPAPSGYRLAERTGAAPAAGDVLELDEGNGRYVVSRVIRSPLPGDARLCAYLASV